MNINIVFKNGYQMTVRCKKFTLKRSPLDNSFQGYQMEGVTGQTPLYVDLDQIQCIVKED